uniref:Mast cell expressed membrane protein 1 n=1 Tax=Sus scrofa TaxID=9823 RepID=A0A8D1XDF2_PIG
MQRFPHLPRHFPVGGDVHRQTSRLGTMETEEIYMNQELKMQAAAFKDKKKGPPACKEGANDPAYENITLTFRNRDQSKSSHSPPKNKVPVRSRPSSDPAQFSHWLHRAMMSLHILLALSCVVLLALVLMKISISVQECQKEQKAGWSTIKERINSNKELIETVKNKVQEGNLKLRTLPTDLTNIKNELRKVTEMLKTPSPSKSGLGRWMSP